MRFMSKTKTSDRAPSVPRQALEALMADKAGHPLHRALQLQALDRQLRPHLPPALARHCRLANVRDGQLVFLVDSPVWHAKLRLAEAGILDAARSLGLKAARVTARTAPAELHSPMQAGTQGGQPVSAATLEHVRRTLASLQDETSGS
ncbi:DUF721 domain-containing protein [Xanthomonas massiliensis]|uniref:DUF721 domain-containing protein n=1 Tax=Xanthomonas massiliensis TaxID=1720302 RepID=UPI00164D4E76|nr:DUF721 domain-containing protein [Xanthomonas massiliensis]